MFVRQNFDNMKIYTVWFPQLGIKTLRAEFTNINPNIKIGFFDTDINFIEIDERISEEDLMLFYIPTGAFYTYYTPVIPNGRLLCM